MISTQIFINNHNIDLYDDEPIKLIYSLADIKNLATRNSTYSLPVTLPATAQNNIIFSNLFDISSDGTNFNPILKTTALVNVDTINIIDGTFQLIEINTDKDQQVSSYKGVIYSNTFDFFKTISNLNLSDITLTADTTKNSTSYLNAIVPSPDPVIAYPLVDRNYGWLYNTITGYTSTDMISIDEIKPCIYYKALLDDIITNAGYTYSSNFLTSTYFKELIIDFNSNELLSVDYSFTIDVGMNGAYFATIPANVYIVRKSAITYIEENIGEYTFDGNDIIGSYTGAHYVGSNNTYERLRKVVSGSTSYQQGDVIGLKIYRPAPFAQGSDFYSYDIFYSSLNLTYKNTINNDIEVETVGPSGYTVNTYLNEWIDMPVIITNPGASWFTDHHIVPPIDFNYLLPNNIKQSDLVQWGVNLFNLYIDIDKTDSKKLIIEPRDDYYALNNIIRDWSSKLDTSKDVSIKLVSELQDKVYKFTYKDDDDIKNSEYKKKYVGHIYGDETIEFTNEFLTNQKKIETGFAPTPMEYIVGSSILIPKIYKESANGNDKIEYKPRLYTNLGYSAVTTLQNNEKYVINWGGSGGGIVPYNYRGFAGDINHPYNPTYSILYADPLEIYYNPPFQYPSQNLYNMFWEKNVKELGDKNSKLVTAYFNLTPADINQLKLNDLIYVAGLDNQYFRLYKIEYDALSNVTTKVILLLVTEQVNNLRAATIIKSRLSNSSINGIRSGRGNVLSNQSLVVGSYNNVGLENTNILVNGDENRVLPFSRYINILGSRNTIAGDNNNIGIFNSNDNTILANYNTAFTQNQISIIGGSGNTISSTGHNVTFIGISDWTGDTANDTVYLNNVVFLGTVNGISLSGTSGYTDLYWLYEGGSGSFKSILDAPNNSITATTYGLIAGGKNNILYLGNQSTVVGGDTNRILLSDYASIFGGTDNTALATRSTIIGGQLNEINPNGFIGTIIGGYQNILNASISIISGGFQNKIENGNLSGIFVGSGNYINGSSNSIIGSDSVTINSGTTANDLSSSLGSRSCNITGFAQKMIGSRSSNIIGGLWNGMSLAVTSNILTSTASTIVSSVDCTLLNTLNSNIFGSYNTSEVIGGSYGNVFGAVNGVIDTSGASNIFGGSHNSIILNSIRASILNGESNIITTGRDSCIFGSYNSNISDSYYANIIGGFFNDITLNVENSVLIGGSNNLITESATTSVLIGGYQNTLTDGNQSIILGGTQNDVYDSADCLILAGVNNNISNSLFSNIIAGTNNTIDSSSENALILNCYDTLITSLTGYTICIGTESFTPDRNHTTYLDSVQINKAYTTPVTAYWDATGSPVITEKDHTILVDLSAGDVVIPLPLFRYDGMNLRFKIGPTSGNRLSVQQSASETIDGDTKIDLVNGYASIHIVYVLSNDDWMVVSSHNM